jgi:hypothetical protein
MNAKSSSCGAYLVTNPASGSSYGQVQCINFIHLLEQGEQLFFNRSQPNDGGRRILRFFVLLSDPF